MTTTKKRPAPNAGDIRPESLLAFSAAVDEHMGRPVGFADLVYRLWTVRAQKKTVSDHRKESFALIKAAYERGVRVVGPNLYVLKSTAEGRGEPYLGVDSEKVKRKHPELWNRSRVAVPYVQTKAPTGLTLSTSGVLQSLPKTPEPHASIVDIVAAYKHPSYAVLKSLRDQETDLLAELDELGAANDWDGLPITFADGWTVSLRRLQFSADRMASLDPATFEAVAVEKTRRIPARVYLALPDGTPAEGEVDDAE